MSTESGVPDYRSTNGLWNQFPYEKIAHRDAIKTNYPEVLAFYRERIQEIEKHAPHEGHLALARLQATGRIEAVVTQNIDGYHTQAGSTDVAEIHGSLRSAICHSCRQEASLDLFLTAIDPRCHKCNGKLRPSIVMFGEQLPDQTFKRSLKMAKECDLFIVLGSSLQVYPAAMLPEQVTDTWRPVSRGKLVVVNHTPTPFDKRAVLKINDSIKDTLVVLEKLLS
jgi:NAD-dependent deacetylase